LSTATRPSPARGLWAVPIVLVLVLLVALGVSLLHSQPRMTGTNSVPQKNQEIGLQRGQEACQGSQLMPKGSGRMRMFISAGDRGGTPRASMRILTREEGVVAQSPGRLVPKGADGFPDTRMDFPVDPPVRHTRLDAYVCIRNTGRLPIVLKGVLTPFGNVNIGRMKLDIALTTLWFAPEEKTWLSELRAVAPRVGRARVGGIWAFWAAGLLLLGAISLALVTAIRENRA
jgi:hypothetical protein